MRTTLERRSENRIPPCGRNDKVYLGRNENVDLWAPTCATAGAAVWAGTAVLARMGIARLGETELLFLFAPLVIAPLGMELGRVLGAGGRVEEIARRLQPAGAGFAVAAMWLASGRRAGLVAIGWLVICGLMAMGGVLVLGKDFADGNIRATRIAMCMARLDLAVGGGWLVASRLGMRPMGIQEPIGLLTAVHFHFAGFATAMIAATTLRVAEKREEQRWLRYLVLTVIGLPLVVAAGFVISPVVKMAAAFLFSASIACLAIFVRLYGRKAENPTARILLQGAAGAVFAGMVLSGTYAVADYMGSDILTIPQMARTHGILNAIGFCLLGLLGWLAESSQQVSPGSSDRGRAERRGEAWESRDRNASNSRIVTTQNLGARATPFSGGVAGTCTLKWNPEPKCRSQSGGFP